MKAKDILITLGAAGIIGAGVYKFNEVSDEMGREVVSIMNEKNNIEESDKNTQLSENKEIDKDIKTLKLEDGKGYLISIDGVETLIILNGFSPNGYLKGAKAPKINIYGKDKNGKYLYLMGTFVLPEGKGQFSDTSYNSEDNKSVERYIKGVPFLYKLNSYSIEEGTMNLSLFPTIEGNLKIINQGKISDSDLKDMGKFNVEKVKKYIDNNFGKLDNKCE